MDDLENKTSKPLHLIPIPQASSSAVSRSALRIQEEAKRKQVARLRVLFFSLSAAIIINIVIAYVLYGVMVQDVTATQEQQLIDKQLDAGIKVLQDFLTTNQKKLDALAKNPIVIDALKEKNTSSLDTLRNSFITQFEQPIDLKILIVGEADVNNEGPAPIRFAELDLIRRAERVQNPFAEAAMINDNWQANFVSVVIVDADKSVLGTLMLSLDLQTIKKHLVATHNGLGELVFQQKFANSAAQNIIKIGAAGTNITQQKPVPFSNWLIKFTESPALMQKAEEPPTIWILAVCGASALSVFLALFLSRIIAHRQKTPVEKTAPTVDEVNKAATENIVESEANPLFQNQDILDIAVIDEDENILGLNDISKKKQGAGRPVLSDEQVPADIFRSYDIRGIVGKDLNPQLAEWIGQAVGSEALDKGENALIVARDGRTHSPQLTAALIKGILSTGCNVVNIGIVPTPVMYFATYQFDDVRSGVMVTASHNPASYNGFKVVINNNALADQAVMDLRERIIAQRFHKGIGEENFREIIPHYIERIFSDVALAGDVSIVIDAGNAVTGIVAPQLFEELGCQVTPLFCDLDGTFPNHEPDPTQERNLAALIRKVQEVSADIGVAFDGDGDRLVVVTPKGDIIWPDRLLMLFAKDILARHPGADVLFDVKCSRQLNQVISGYGGRPIMWKTGHSPMKAKMVETGALIGGEYSGHIFIKDRWYGFDDGIYAMARLLEIITLRDQKIDDIFAAFPQLIITPEIKVNVPDKSKFELMKKLVEQGEFQNGNITTIDGIRVDYSKGWGLARASNTSPALTLRFEAESEEALNIIKQVFKRELLKIDATLQLNF